MKRRILPFFELLLVVAGALLLLTGSYYAPSETTSPLISNQTDDKNNSHSLTVITNRSYHTYFQNEKRAADGLALQLVRQFAKQYHYQLNIVIAEHPDDIYQALNDGLADIALMAQQLSLSKQNTYSQSAPYMNVTTELVYRHGNGEPLSFDDLAGKTVVLHDSEQLREKQQYIASHYPDIQWEFSSLAVEELVGMVNSGHIAYTFIDSHDYLTLRALYTRTRIAFPIYYPQPLAFTFADTSAAQLQTQLNTFLNLDTTQNKLTQWLERYYGHSYDVNPRGAQTFFARVNYRLPKYQTLIEQIAEQYQLDWRLLAAVSYQESHWDPLAKSPTGVRGMMMLTQQTAKLMNVDNRLDTEQSLRGGAAYLRNLMAQLPESITQPDRTWFALASYNVGLGHIYDVREITAFHGGNPDHWVDVKKYLPLLEKPEWHQYTRYGYARGNEPVSYVQNIRHFRDLLEWRFPQKARQSTIAAEASTTIQPLALARQKQQQNALNPKLQPVRLSSLIQ